MHWQALSWSGVEAQIVESNWVSSKLGVPVAETKIHLGPRRGPSQALLFWVNLMARKAQ